MVRIEFCKFSAFSLEFSNVFLNHKNIFSCSRSEQFSKQNTLKKVKKKEKHCYLKIKKIIGLDNWQQEPSLKHSDKFWANQNYEGDYWVVFLSLVIISQ